MPSQQMHIGAPKVACWFCGKNVLKMGTTRLPNGARVCRNHACELCGDYIHPNGATRISFGRNDAGKEIIEHVCAGHRRYIIECTHRGGAPVRGPTARPVPPAPAPAPAPVATSEEV